MNAVLYTNDFEPITVIDVPHHWWERFKRGDMLIFRVLPKLDLQSVQPDEPLRVFDVRIRAERFRHRGAETLMLFTEDEETALMLKSEFLPGQRKELRQMAKDNRVRGFGEGFLAALNEMGFRGRM